MSGQGKGNRQASSPDRTSSQCTCQSSGSEHSLQPRGYFPEPGGAYCSGSEPDLQQDQGQDARRGLDTSLPLTGRAGC